MATTPFHVEETGLPVQQAETVTACVQEPSRARVYFGAAPVDTLGMDEASRWLIRELGERRLQPSREPLQVMGPNAFLVTLAAKNPAFAAALQQADLCLPDGMSVVWGARLLGRSVAERVPGGEFMERVCALGAAHGLSVYLLGGLPNAAAMAAQVLASRYPGLVIAGTDCPPFNFEQDATVHDAVRARIAAARPDFLFVALGAPKQEIWMLDECPSLPIGAAMSVGAAFDTLAGLRRRAPAWTHNIGLEWLYRLAMEPRRLWKRYLIGNLQFALITAKQGWVSRKQRATGKLLQAQRNEPATGMQAGIETTSSGVSPAMQSGVSRIDSTVPPADSTNPKPF